MKSFFIWEVLSTIENAICSTAALCGLSESQYETAHRDYKDYVRKVLNARGCPADLLPDMQQAVWLRLWERRSEYDSKRASLRTFISFVTGKTLSDHWRSVKDVNSAGPADDLPSADELSLTDLRNDLAKVLTTLDLQLLPLLEQGYTASQIAIELDQPVRTVNKRLYAMRRRIKKYTAHG